MAMMISVPTRGTDTKKNILEIVRLKTRKLKLYLATSVLLNLIFITLIIFKGK
jgi:hypothetical protein